MRRVRRFLKVVRPGAHILLFYESARFKHEVLSTYLKSGLEKGITTLYISYKEPVADILRGMRSFGIGVEGYARERLFELWEITPDLVQPIDRQPLFDDPPSDGPFVWFTAYLEGRTIKKPLVVVADDRLHNMEAGIAVNYEKFHSLRLHYTPISMICTYSVEEVSWEGKLFLDLVKTHRHIIIQTEGKIISL